MGLFNGIFDTLGSDVSNFFSGNDSLGTYATVGKDALAIGGSLGAGGSGSLNSPTSLSFVNKADTLERGLNQGTVPITNKIQTNSMPPPQGNQSQPAQGVNINTIEDQWNQRLSRYADTTRDTGVSQTGR